jgi:hypothetical protein
LDPLETLLSDHAQKAASVNMRLHLVLTATPHHSVVSKLVFKPAFPLHHRFSIDPNQLRGLNQNVKKFLVGIEKQVNEEKTEEQVPLQVIWQRAALGNLGRERIKEERRKRTITHFHHLLSRFIILL